MNRKILAFAVPGLAVVFAASSGCADLSKGNYFHDLHISKSHMNRDVFVDLKDFQAKLEKIEKMNTLTDAQLVRLMETLNLTNEQVSILKDETVVSDHLLEKMRKETGLTDYQAKKIKVMTGLTEQAVFEALGVDGNRFTPLPTKEIMPTLTGTNNLNLNGSEAIEKSMEITRVARIYEIQFKEVDTHGALKWPAAAQTEQEGWDVKMQLAFIGGKLYWARETGPRHVNGKEIIYPWQFLSQAALGAGVGAGVATGIGFVK